MDTKDIDSIIFRGITYYSFIECCLVLDLTPSHVRYCIANGGLIVNNGIEYISEDALWGNLYRQSRQYYKDLEVKRMIDTTNPLF